MADHIPWFRCDPSRLLGALSGMEPDCGYLYTIILMRIYEVGGPVSDDEGILSRRIGFSVRRVASALAWLVDHGQIELLENGALDSHTTHDELAFREKSVNDARNAGKESAKRKQPFHGEKPKQNQQNDATAAERPLDASSTAEQRPSTDIEVDIEKKENLTVLCPKRVRTKVAYPSDFEEFWRAYPTDPNMGKKEAFSEWQRLSPEDRRSAIASCPSFRLYCETHKDYRPIHASRYLARGRFEGHLQSAVAASERVFVRIGSDEWRAWEAWYHRVKGHGPQTNKEGNGWYFPSAFPPDISEAV